MSQENQSDQRKCSGKGKLLNIFLVTVKQSIRVSRAEQSERESGRCAVMCGDYSSRNGSAGHN